MANTRLTWIICGLVVALSVIAGVAVRFIMLESHFSHVDDIGVGRTILETKIGFNEYLEKITDRKEELMSGSRGAAVGSVVRELDRFGLWKVAAHLRAYFDLWHSVPAGWTSAPLQFYLTTLLVREGMNYSEVKFFGRLPSFLVGVGAFFLAGLAAFRGAAKGGKLEACAIAVMLVALSWQATIYSAQMQSYSIGVFALLALVLAIQWIAEPGRRLSGRDALAVGLVVSLASLAQYQILIFFPAFYLVYFRSLYKEGGIGYATVRSLQSGAVFLLISAPLLRRFLSGRGGQGLNYNTGPAREFVFDFNGISLGEIANFLKFIFVNFPVVVEAMLSPVLENSPASRFVTVFLCVFALAGLLVFFLQPTEASRSTGVFFSIGFLAWCSVVYLGKMAFSPTRHSMVLIPLIVLSISNAVAALVALCRENHERLVNFFVAIVSILWIGMYLWSAPIEISERSDRNSEQLLLSKLSESGTSVLFLYDLSLAPYLMPSVVQRFPICSSAHNADRKIECRMPAVSEISRSPYERCTSGFSTLSHVAPISRADREAVVAWARKFLGCPAESEIQVFHEVAQSSSREIDWSTRTGNGRNGFYFLSARFVIPTPSNGRKSD